MTASGLTGALGIRTTSYVGSHLSRPGLGAPFASVNMVLLDDSAQGGRNLG